jgi:two-component system LytT family response regulator
MKKIRTLIVDDEPHAREGLQIILTECEEVELAGEARNGEEALEMIESLNPDLVFLDIEMPDMSGFEVVSKLDSAKPYIVFATAYDQHAIRAFEIHALDYLLKPIDRTLVRRSIDRIVELIGKEASSAQLAKIRDIMGGTPDNRSQSGKSRTLSVKADGKTLLLKKDKIPLIQASGDYVLIHYLDSKYMVHEKLKKMEKDLENDGFVRIHRSSLINRQSIQSIRNLSFGEYEITLERCRERVRSSRSYHETVRKLMRSGR